MKHLRVWACSEGTKTGAGGQKTVVIRRRFIWQSTRNSRVTISHRQNGQHGLPVQLRVAMAFGHLADILSWMSHPERNHLWISANWGFMPWILICDFHFWLVIFRVPHLTLGVAFGIVVYISFSCWAMTHPRSWFWGQDTVAMQCCWTQGVWWCHLGVSKNRGGPPKSSILIGFSLINYPFWGTPIFGNIHLKLADVHPISPNNAIRWHIITFHGAWCMVHVCWGRHPPVEKPQQASLESFMMTALSSVVSVGLTEINAQVKKHPESPNCPIRYANQMPLCHYSHSQFHISGAPFTQYEAIHQRGKFVKAPLSYWEVCERRLGKLSCDLTSSQIHQTSE